MALSTFGGMYIFCYSFLDMMEQENDNDLVFYMFQHY